MKITVIAQHIIPIQTPRSHRATELVKELAKQGHEVTVYSVLGKYNYKDFSKEYKVNVKNIPVRMQVSSYNSDGKGKRTFFDKLMSKLFNKLFEFPNIELLYSIPKILKSEVKADLLISIADPHPIHWGCARAKKICRENFPATWIADCGDPYMDNGKTKDHYQYFSKYERKFCESCDFLTVPIDKAVNGYYPEYRHKIRVIPQGFSFDIANYNKYGTVPENKVITFAYAGTFYNDIRNPATFFDYLLNLDIDFKFIVYTRFPQLIQHYKRKLKDQLEIREPIDRSDLIEVLKRMDFLVNIENVDRPNQIPSKLIDYAIARRPILSVDPQNINTDLYDEFMKKNYSNRLMINNIELYHISNVVEQFISLAAEKNNSL